MIHPVIFYLISALLIFSAIRVVTLRGLFASALYLAAALSLVGAVFVLVGADFLFAVQILLYVGGILVLIVFAVMLSNAEQLKSERQTNRQWVPALVLCLGVVLILAVAVKKHAFVIAEGVQKPTTLPIGKLLLGEMILPFEVVSLVLLAALVGAVLFSRKEKS